MTTGSPPPIACTLTAGDQAERLAEFRRLFATSVRQIRREATRLELVLDASMAPESGVRDLLRREQECCSFVTFQVESVDSQICVAAEVPDAAQAWLDELQHLAEHPEPAAD
jgi:hypothetical protein